MTITPAEFLKIEMNLGISFDNPSFIALADATVRQLQDLPVKTVLDFGAGTGVYAESYRKAGYSVFAFEIWQEHRDYMKKHAPELVIVDEPLTTDLMNFIETAEHMTDEELFAVFKKISPTYIAFSSISERRPDDLEWGHINLKEQKDWIAFFKNLGYTFVRDLQYPTAWAKLFKKEP